MDGHIEATLSFCTLTVLAVVVEIVVAFEMLLEDISSGGWDTGVRVERTASGSGEYRAVDKEDGNDNGKKRGTGRGEQGGGAGARVYILRIGSDGATQIQVKQR